MSPRGGPQWTGRCRDGDGTAVSGSVLYPPCRTRTVSYIVIAGLTDVLPSGPVATVAVVLRHQSSHGAALYDWGSLSDYGVLYVAAATHGTGAGSGWSSVTQRAGRMSPSGPRLNIRPYHITGYTTLRQMQLGARCWERRGNSDQTPCSSASGQIRSRSGVG